MQNPSFRAHFTLFMRNSVYPTRQELTNMNSNQLWRMGITIGGHIGAATGLLEVIRPSESVFIQIRNERDRLIGVLYHVEMYQAAARWSVPLTQLRYTGYHDNSHRFERLPSGRGLIPPPIITHLTSSLEEAIAFEDSLTFHRPERTLPLDNMSEEIEEDPSSSDDNESVKSFVSNLYDDPIST